jgi:hypothetical protein
MCYVYIQTERNPALYTVGFYKPNAEYLAEVVFEAESDWPDRKAAAARVHYLNGGDPGFDMVNELGI